mmetsp:Transcript_106895/g.319607  ORF Transcript_106895/g.319607 Transcript_106895/m.319607 type:complete len:258 (-) Transcript_106895:351-1124(-)
MRARHEGHRVKCSCPATDCMLRSRPKSDGPDKGCAAHRHGPEEDEQHPRHVPKGQRLLLEHGTAVPEHLPEASVLQVELALHVVALLRDDAQSDSNADDGEDAEGQVEARQDKLPSDVDNHIGHGQAEHGRNGNHNRDAPDQERLDAVCCDLRMQTSKRLEGEGQHAVPVGPEAEGPDDSEDHVPHPQHLQEDDLHVSLGMEGVRRRTHAVVVEHVDVKQVVDRDGALHQDEDARHAAEPELPLALGLRCALPGRRH